ncbi:unnamed protein product [Vitrella brassicaformis CCMP3155]|uniref:HMG box domain-containing protein n=1 Tax=Vitrella brassicaformis (strain CCMP3155) TaxID=1169540 RepID=A0A0G4FB55_VITBC|nr:unnamed protein product [Vitrella brassicaformis CCMP3155]|eukprot:CEM09862.1 unnamed protein product [Vitrella brassicaformis CCMP3155]
MPSLRGLSLCPAGQRSCDHLSKLHLCLRVVPSLLVASLFGLSTHRWSDLLVDSRCLSTGAVWAAVRTAGGTMSSTSASAAASREHIGVGNRSGALVDQSMSAAGSTSVAGSLLNALRNLCVLQSRGQAVLESLYAGSPISAEMASGALSDLASHTEGCGSAIARLDSLVQGSSGARETTEEASDAAHEGFLSCPKGDLAGKKLHNTGGQKSSKKSGKTSSKPSSAKSEGGSGVKRPPGKFILFCNERRAALKQEMEAEGVDAAPKGVNKRLGEEWNTMDEDEKKPYKDKAEELLAAWKQSTGGDSSSKKGKKGKGDEDDEDEGEEDENEAVQGQGGAKRCRVDGLPESSGAAQPVFLPGLSLPTDVMRDVFLPLITPNDSTALCRTSEAVSSALEAGVAADIDSIIRHDGLTGVIGYRQVRQSTGVRRLVRRLRLIRLHYLMVAGGDWRGSVPLLRLAKSCGRVKQLPIELTKNDLQHVGSKAVIDSRPPSMRQYALFSHRLSQRMRLTRDAGGGDEMGGDEVTVYTDQTVPARYRDRFDPDDPVCEYGGVVYDGFRGMIIKSMAFGSSRLVSNRFYNGRPPSAECHRINVLLDQQPPLWDCRTIGYHLHTPRRFVILCGDEEGDDFLAFIEMTKYTGHMYPDGAADMYLYTTEAPQSGVGAAGSPLTVSIARNKMGDDIRALPDVDEASNTAVAAVLV